MNPLKMSSFKKTLRNMFSKISCISSARDDDAHFRRRRAHGSSEDSWSLAPSIATEEAEAFEVSVDGAIAAAADIDISQVQAIRRFQLEAAANAVPKPRQIYSITDPITGFTVRSGDVANVCYSCRVTYINCNCHLGCVTCKEQQRSCFCFYVRMLLRPNTKCWSCMELRKECNCWNIYRCKWCIASLGMCRKGCLKGLPKWKSSFARPFVYIFQLELQDEHVLAMLERNEINNDPVQDDFIDDDSGIETVSLAVPSSFGSSNSGIGAFDSIQVLHGVKENEENYN